MAARQMSRRDFIKSAGAVTATATLAGSLSTSPLAQAAPAVTSKKSDLVSEVAADIKGGKPTMVRTFGVHAGQQNCPLDELRRLWRYVDQAGFDWLSVWDHFYEAPFIDGNGSCFETVSALTLLAVDTRTVRVGCLVFCIGYRHPAVLAKALATIDHVSNGRLEVGLGAGWYELEHHEYGLPFPAMGVRHDQLDEAVQIVRGLLTQSSTTFTGKYFRVQNARCNPKPLQARLPLWIGGAGEKRTLRTAARYADGWNIPYVSPAVFRAKNQVLNQWCEKEGRDPATLRRTVNVGFYLKTDATAAEAERQRFLTQWGPQAEKLEGGMLFGTPKQAVERVGEYFDAGASRVTIALRAPFEWEALQGYTEDVLPAFR
ncbi:MAG TPA: TIGR03560 family F420-dependent LLM class oxidoreductase [Candidatus Binatia bacterium]|jgi:F420-dependent oxidoreductase-like protein|nr:TIGR03560 family F420-dependent LLM class oxidoreductase [Candidatus Binatia bacterium]